MNWTNETAKKYVENCESGNGIKGLKYCSAKDYLAKHCKSESTSAENKENS